MNTALIVLPNTERYFALFCAGVPNVVAGQFLYPLYFT